MVEWFSQQNCKMLHIKCKIGKWRLRDGVLVLICLISVLPGFGQTDLSISGKSLAELQQGTTLSIPTTLVLPAPTPPSTQKKEQFPSLHQLFHDPQSIKQMPKAYSYHDLGFFCKLEVKMEKKARFPVKVRLGEVQYVERMEGKYE